MRGCLGIVVLAVIAVVAFAAAGSHGGGTTATTATEPTPAASTAVHHAPAGKACGATHANAHASCPFAENVYTAYRQFVAAHSSAPERLSVYSPVTHQTYSAGCVVHVASPSSSVECVAGSAVIKFPFPHVESEAPVEQDEVGSTSHATDEKFCEEHTCEGDFTTEPGTIVKCTDGDYSHAGGISGACSYHGGEASDRESEEEGSS
jgi:hypothetical protein